MRKSRFSERQIVVILKQAEAGVPIQDLVRKHGISEQTFYRWRKKYGGLGASELQQLKQLKEENQRLKGLVADLTLDKQILQEVLAKKWLNREGAGRGQIREGMVIDPGTFEAQLRRAKEIGHTGELEVFRFEKIGYDKRGERICLSGFSTRLPRTWRRASIFCPTIVGWHDPVSTVRQLFPFCSQRRLNRLPTTVEGPATTR